LHLKLPVPGIIQVHHCQWHSAVPRRPCQVLPATALASGTEAKGQLSLACQWFKFQYLFPALH